MLFRCDLHTPERFWIKWQRHCRTLPIKNVQSCKSHKVDKKCSTLPAPSSDGSLGYNRPQGSAVDVASGLLFSKIIFSAKNDFSGKHWNETFSLTNLLSDQNTTQAKKQTTDLLKLSSRANWWSRLSECTLERLSEGQENVCGTSTLIPSCQETIFGCLATGCLTGILKPHNVVFLP